MGPSEVNIVNSTALSRKERSRLLVVDALQRHGMQHATTWLDSSYKGLPQQQAAKITGLSTATISGIFGELRDVGVLTGDNGVLDPALGAVFGVDIGYSQIRVAIADLNGQLLADPVELSTPLGDQAWRSVEWIADTVKALFSEAITEGLSHDTPVLGIGISVPAPINERTGTLNRRWNVGGDWQFVSPVNELRERLGWNCEITLDRDANASAIAEAIWGRARDVGNVFYVKWSDNGVAAGLILNHGLFRGADGWAGEVGHAVIPKFAGDEGSFTSWLEGLPTCAHCNQQGCLFTATSIDALRAHAGNDSLTAADLVELARSGRGETTGGEQQRVYEGITQAARAVGRALAPSIDALQPQRVILGGKIGARIYPVVAVPLNEGMQEASVSVATHRPDTYAGDQGLIGPASVRGAVALALVTPQPKLLEVIGKAPVQGATLV